MLSPFTLKLPRQIVFGPGKLSELENILGRFGIRPLLVLGGRSFAATEHSALLEKMFTRLEMPVHTVHIHSEPSPEMIDTIVTDLAGEDIDLVIALGGGSVLDGGKAISVMLREKGTVTRFLEGVGSTTPSGRKLPFIAIPTTSGTGSEVTSNAVISSIGSQGFKSSLRHDNFIPDLALVDPILTLSCPEKLTIACGMDCFSQLVEGYLSTNGSSLTDALAVEGLKAIYRSLRLVCTDGSNLPARTDLAYAALLSGIVLSNSGLGTVHGFASALGGLFAIPHGLVCGTLMAPVNALTLKNLRTKGNNPTALTKYAQLGGLLSDQQNKTDVWYQDYFIEELARLTDDLDIAPLSAFGVSSADIENIVAKTGNKYNPTPLSREDLAIILRSRIRQ
jgi:alcohol dehydrogenase class IV